MLERRALHDDSAKIQGAIGAIQYLSWLKRPFRSACRRAVHFLPGVIGLALPQKSDLAL
jgi:hypothetical protein